MTRPSAVCPMLVFALAPVVAFATEETVVARTASQPTALRYTFELLAAPQRAVRIRLDLETPDANRSEIDVQPHWGGEENVHQEVLDLRIQSASGAALPVRSTADAPHRWTFSHTPRERVSIVYELRPPPDRIQKNRNQYRPILTEDLFHFIGEVGLIAPSWVSVDVPCAIQLEWRGFAEAGWTVVSSFGLGSAPRRIESSISDFRHALYFAGKLRVTERAAGAGTLAVAIFGDQWSFSDAEFADLAANIVQCEREFFRDLKDPYFLISLLPMRDEGPNSSSLGGTGLTNCFALFCSPNMSLAAEGPNRLSVLHLLAHEYFHTWNGQRIECEEPEELVYWFSEGFTDFYAARLLYNAGLISAQDWVARTNADLRDYWTSPMRGIDDERIKADFWKDDRVQKIPYKRGAALALALDWEIRRCSDGKRSLDDFLRETLARAREQGEKINNERLFAQIAAWTSSETAARLRDVAEKGADLVLPAEMFKPELEIEQTELRPFTPGFDISASMDARKVAGVTPDGPAAQAGLRDDMKIVGVSIFHGDTTKPIELTIEENGKPRKFEYMPLGAPILAPQFKLVRPPKF